MKDEILNVYVTTEAVQPAVAMVSTIPLLYTIAELNRKIKKMTANQGKNVKADASEVQPVQMDTENEENEDKPKYSRRPEVPVWCRSGLTVDQAAAYSGVGKDKIRELSDREDCPFVLWIGTKRLIRREKFDEYLNKAFSI